MDSVDEAPAGEADSTREQHVRVKLRKPMGMVLAEGSGTVFVEEVISGGNADKSSKIEVGDVISRCAHVDLPRLGNNPEFAMGNLQHMLFCLCMACCLSAAAFDRKHTSHAADAASHLTVVVSSPCAITRLLLAMPQQCDAPPASAKGMQGALEVLPR